jgi:hypothetical protein
VASGVGSGGTGGAGVDSEGWSGSPLTRFGTARVEPTGGAGGAASPGTEDTVETGSGSGGKGTADPRASPAFTVPDQAPTSRVTPTTKVRRIRLRPPPPTWVHCLNRPALFDPVDKAASAISAN